MVLGAKRRPASNRFSTSVLPISTWRSASTCSLVRSLDNPSKAARTRFFSLLEPKDLVKQSRTPTNSSTARTVAPAITPVPGAAGSSLTTDAPYLDVIACGKVPSWRVTVFKLFLATF